MSRRTVTASVDGRTLVLTNLDKVLYPAAGFTKGEVVDYYTRIAPVLLPHLHGRPVTFHRFPDGVESPGFFEKRCPGHRPQWVPVRRGPGDRRGTIGYCGLEERAALVWSANLAALELHVTMARADDLDRPTAVVFDLDPGAPAAIRECAEAALEIRVVLAAVGLDGWVKTSGSKGLQVYVPLNTPHTYDDTAGFALALGQVLERRRPGAITTTMAKAERPGRVFVDWSQNNRHKTTVAVYSLRARSRPTVSTPVSWDEVERAAVGHDDLRFEASAVLARVAAHGDLFGPVLTVEQELPTRR